MKSVHYVAQPEFKKFVFLFYPLKYRYRCVLNSRCLFATCRHMRGRLQGLGQLILVSVILGKVSQKSNLSVESYNVSTVHPSSSSATTARVNKALK